MNARQTVTTIGWIWLGLGVLSFVSGVGGFLASTFMGLPTSPLPVRSVVMDFLWQHYREGALIQAIVALFIVFSSYMFLRRHTWARVVLQVFSALLLAWTVLFGVFWVRGLAAGSDQNQFFMVFRVVMLAGGAVVMGIFALAFGYCIWTLSRAAVREEFRNVKQMA